MSSHELNNKTRDAILKIYHTHGIKAADKKINDLLLQCETWKDDTQERGVIKGELSEVALECHLLHWMQVLDFAVCIKSLCIKSKESNATAEIDMLLATPQRIYMFECKSFKGEKELTKECYLKGSSSEKDVFEQSRYHLQLLEQHLAPFHSKKKLGRPPYQFCLFELSSNSIVDLREEKWKRAIPALTLNTLDNYLYKEFTQPLAVQWDYHPLVDKLKELNDSSEGMFKYHMHKIMNRKKMR